MYKKLDNKRTYLEKKLTCKGSYDMKQVQRRENQDLNWQQSTSRSTSRWFRSSNDSASFTVRRKNQQLNCFLNHHWTAHSESLPIWKPLFRYSAIYQYSAKELQFSKMDSKRTHHFDGIYSRRPGTLTEVAHHPEGDDTLLWLSTLIQVSNMTPHPLFWEAGAMSCTRTGIRGSTEGLPLASCDMHL